MPTNTKGNPARELPFQATHYLRKTINFNDSGIASGIGFAQWLPQGAQILRCNVIILTVFNAGTTNVLTVGTNAGTLNDIVAAADVDETALGLTAVLTGAKLDISAADLQPFIKYTQTGTAGTTGKARVVIEYVPANDE